MNNCSISEVVRENSKKFKKLIAIKEDNHICTIDLPHRYDSVVDMSNKKLYVIESPTEFDINVLKLSNINVIFGDMIEIDKDNSMLIYDTNEWHIHYVVYINNKGDNQMFKQFLNRLIGRKNKKQKQASSRSTSNDPVMNTMNINTLDMAMSENSRPTTSSEEAKPTPSSFGSFGGSSGFSTYSGGSSSSDSSSSSSNSSSSSSSSGSSD